ncbi:MULTISPECIES: glutathione S-transferase C-terminal domain-containing protein [Lactobacillaceae]|jgi:putative glutathione S-transferase|nr:MULTISPECIES: glutathione S-transferase C-terminal domain-containing protein [Lactobacillaceae]AUJ30966.1 glutathione S-transferase [Liquorilactobacillus hordei]AUJ33314.1 glutathione S-transferase [Liquorilactobacillus nagelii]EJF00230.1 glutathione S-transferase [Liquorilactobacillus mali KCTC 3596 = DSM 20444]MBB6433462.1 putative glutathione S-transferase [Leuconostoc carnosum]MCC7617243.1 glutathione S-transferase [Liquorilactobacillus nagelii]
MTENLTCEFQPKQPTTVTQSTVTIDKRFSTNELPVEAGRYRLILGRFCPWATQVAIEIDYLGLDQVISKGVIYPLRRNGIQTDWWFGERDDFADPVLKTTRLSQNYQKALPSFEGRSSVPALVDIKTGKVVNNVTNTLLDELALKWGRYANEKQIEFFPQTRIGEFKTAAADILENINRLPGKITTVKSQAEYEKLVQIFFDHLAKFDQVLRQQKYLWGDKLTQLDVRLYVTLLRFDLVYYYQNKLSLHRLTDYPALWAYAKRLAQIPAFKNYTDFEDIKKHFYQQDDRPITTFERVIPLLDEQKWLS